LRRSLSSRQRGEAPKALHALEQDHAFLLKGDVFTRDVIETWIAYKREKELDEAKTSPARIRTILRHLTLPGTLR
jgi:glutamine synthetase